MVIGHYRIDFYCVEEKLVIELDGNNHYIGHAPQDDLAREVFIVL
ncbi:DUF559 domain-containing protein [Celerinatantimonas yamalensis]|uniref:DUF559 domain-containing protein n=1 Tax=Celerinatantimonas yamalensis TaxID=559956 RepID=A0ABW9G5G0_9GAMM